jgi:hypothetical protein
MGWFHPHPYPAGAIPRPEREGLASGEHATGRRLAGSIRNAAPGGQEEGPTTVKHATGRHRAGRWREAREEEVVADEEEAGRLTPTTST